MAKLWVRDGNGRPREVEVRSRVELEAQGIGKKWTVSLDGGRKYRPYREVTAAEWDTFLAAAQAPATERPALAEPRTTQAASPAPAARAEDGEAARRAAALEERVRTLGTQVDMLARGALGRQDLEALRGALQQEIVAITEAGRRQLDETLGPRLDAAAAAITARIESQLARLRKESARLDDLAEEQVESVARYRPGTIDTLRQQLEAERAEVERLRQKSSAQTQKLDEREAELSRLRASDGAVDPSVLERLREEVARLRNELDSRREVEAERDDLRRRLGELEVHQARWKTQQQAYEADLELRRKVEVLLDEAQRGASEYDTLRADHVRCQESCKDLRERLKAREDQLREGRERERKSQVQIADLEQTTAALTAERDALRTARDGSIARAAEAEARYSAAQRALAEDARRWKEAQEALYNQRREALSAEAKRDAERELIALREGRRQAEAERDEAKRRALQAEARASRHEQDALDAREAQRQWRADEGERMARLREQDVRLKALQEEVQRVEARCDTLRGEEKAQWSDLAAQRAEALAELEHLTVQVASQRATLERLEDELGRRRGEAHAERAARVEILETPYFEAETEATHPQGDERAWLAEVRERMAAAGFQFSPRIVESFHTSLKIAAWAPLTVLAGVSGTGKSELPRLYSRYGGLRFLPVPVQPNWDSPQDLFGFFDYVGGRFRATALVRAMVQSQRPREEGGFDDGLLLVLLDEMNLARVELYFSELLSRLETRRGLDRATARQQCAVAIDLGAGVKEYPLPLGENVLWAGTMNEDESTQTLSDKVLDRGNVLTFPRPRRLHLRPEVPLGDAAAHLPRRTWEAWLRRPEDTLDPDTRTQMREAIDELNGALSAVQRAVGHRVMQAMERYVANHPRVCGPASRELTLEDWRMPFEDQLVQKVMPKLRGVSVDSKAGRRCLDGVRAVLERSAAGLVGDFERARSESQGAFVWNQSSYLEEGGG